MLWTLLLFFNLKAQAGENAPSHFTYTGGSVWTTVFNDLSSESRFASIAGKVN